MHTHQTERELQATLDNSLPLTPDQARLYPVNGCVKLSKVLLAAVVEQALQQFDLNENAYAFGDVSFHSSWTLQRAGVNAMDRPRVVTTTTYRDQKSSFDCPETKNYVEDLERWAPGLQAGEALAPPLNPITHSFNNGHPTVAQDAW